MHEAERAIAEARSKTDSYTETTKLEEDEDDALLLEIEHGR